ncbi:MAG: hypothetical protein CMN58_07935 [Solibacterales bacterium]|nr:hypothetical protein [Bryobacterales bacterium]|tara:strand:+ start:19244 stop:19636 length:393 start_codon:yes stop_codon:yes gene_type:complete
MALRGHIEEFGLITRRSALHKVTLYVLSCKALSARKKKRKSKPTAIIAGTAFRGVGFSFPGVDIKVVNKMNPDGMLRGVTDKRGEFSVRIPSGKAIYSVTATAKGFIPLEKEVEIYGMERVTVNFRMVAE